MAIRFEYGPPQSALGALAYQAGAAEAADRRRREVEQMQMQAAQMRQKQQQAALDRQFNAWRTKYDHFSSLDKMEREHEWKDDFQAKGHENAKELYDFESAEKRRSAEIAHIRSLEKQRQASEQIGDRARFADIRTKQNARIEQLRRGLNQNGVGAEAQAKKQYNKVINKPNLSPQHRQQARSQYLSSLEQILSDPNNTRDPYEWEEGGVSKTSKYGVRRAFRGGKTIWEFDPDFDPKKLRVHVGDGRDKDGNTVKYFQVAKISNGQLTYEREEQVVGVAPEKGIDYATAHDDLFKVEEEVVFDGTENKWVKTGRKVYRFTPEGEAAYDRSGLHTKPGGWNYEPWDRKELVEFYRKEQNQAPAAPAAPGAAGPAAPEAAGPAAPGAMLPGSPGSAKDYAEAEREHFSPYHPGMPRTAAGDVAHGIGRMAGAAAQVPGMMARQAGAAIAGSFATPEVRQFHAWVGGVERELQEADKMNPKMRELLGRARNIQDLPQDQLDVLAEEIAKEKALLERFGMGLGDLEDGFKNQLNPQR